MTNEKLTMLACCAAIMVFGTQAAPRIPKAELMQPDWEDSEYLRHLNLRSDESLSSGSIGDMNVDTTSVMNKSRCGVVDKVEPSTGSRSRRWSPSGDPWTKRNLTYTIAKHSDQLLDRNGVYRKIAAAFAMWAKYVDLRFTLVSSEEADIVIKFERGSHGDVGPFDGPGGTLAHAFSPGYGLGGDIHFDDENEWDLEKLYHVAVHEIGHALGLSHTNVPGSAMLSFYPDNVVEELGTDDITGIQALYGKKGAEKDPVLCTDLRIDTIFDSPDGSIYAFKGKYYWKVTKEGNADGSPELITSKWKELPGDIDAAFTYNRKTYFFKESTMWTYIGDIMIRYPTEISKGFPGIPNDIDAAILWTADRNIYFFKGSKYWRYQLRAKIHVSSANPRPITDWRGLPRKLDAALSFDGNTYFFKGEEVYQFDDKTISVDKKGPQRMKSDFFGCL